MRNIPFSYIQSCSTTHGETLKKWLTEAIISRLEDELDAAAALEAMSDDEGMMSLEDYLILHEKSKAA
jgi:hypothetical protein